MSILIKNNIIDIDGNEIQQTKLNKNEVNDMARINWDKEKLDKIQSMLNEGKTQKQIGEHFGVTAGNISAICVKHNIKKVNTQKEIKVVEAVSSESEIECVTQEVNSCDNLKEFENKNLKEAIDSIENYSDYASTILQEIINGYDNSNITDFTLGVKLTKILETLDDISFKCAECKIDGSLGD